MTTTIDRELIEHFIEVTWNDYDQDIIVLDLSSLFLLSPASLIIPNSVNFDIQSSIFLRELIEYITTEYIDLDNPLAVQKILSHIITKINTATMSTLSADSLLDSGDYPYRLIVSKLKEFITHYLALINRYAEGYINAYTVNQMSELEMVNKLYIPTSTTVYISDMTIRMQNILVLKTKR